MATVLKDNAQVAHYWANKVQSEGRTSSGSFFFRDNRLYSYGSHFLVGEHLPDGSVAITTNTHSKTTGRHADLARRAVPFGVNVVRVPLCDTIEGALNVLSIDVGNHLARAERARLYKVDMCEEVATMLDHFEHYVKAKSITLTETQLATLADMRQRATTLATETPEQKAARLEAERRHGERLAERERKQLELQRMEAAERIERWRRGEQVYGLPRLDGALLRLAPVPHPANQDDFVIQTSWGADVPATHAWRLWPLIEMVRRRGKDRTGLSKRVGYYTLTAIDSAGNITVGCHRIKYEELAAMHEQMLAAGFAELPTMEEEDAQA